MNLKDSITQVAPALLEAVGACKVGGESARHHWSVAGQHAVQETLSHLVALLFPGCHMRAAESPINFEDYHALQLETTALHLRDQCRQAFEYKCQRDKCDPDECHNCETRATEVVAGFVEELPAMLGLLQADVQAAYEGDPAAQSELEVVLSYPGVYATIVHRLAHSLYTKGVPLIPRVMSETAHSRTGIDIHPGARLGPGFFIDHGTGVVIGETCLIGSNVKIYQGVTLGALSFEKDEEGHLVKGIKRHPNVGDHVVIYAGATILGGKTQIGDHSVIGGNVWLTHSVPPHSKVYNHQPNPLIRQSNGQWRTAAGSWSDLGAGI
jgi:serine O-acetyltransferase